MSWDIVGKSVNSNFKIPLNHLIWLHDYKTYGQDSYVYNNKDILHELYRSPIAINDNAINQEVHDYLNSIDELGILFGNIYGIENKEVFKEMHTITDIINSDAAVQSICKNADAIHWLFNNDGNVEACINSETVMDNIQNSETAMNIVCADKNILLAFYNNYSITTPYLAESPYLLTSAQKSPLYAMTSNTALLGARVGATSTGWKSAHCERTHYSGKVFVLGYSDTDSHDYTSIVDSLDGVLAKAANDTEGNDGLTWRINKFAAAAKCHPAAILSDSAVYVDIDGTSYMAYLKIS